MNQRKKPLKNQGLGNSWRREGTSKTAPTGPSGMDSTSRICPYPRPYPHFKSASRYPQRVRGFRAQNEVFARGWRGVKLCFFMEIEIRTCPSITPHSSPNLAGVTTPLSKAPPPTWGAFSGTAGVDPEPPFVAVRRTTVNDTNTSIHDASCNQRAYLATGSVPEFMLPEPHAFVFTG